MKSHPTMASDTFDDLPQAQRSFHPLELIPGFSRWRPGFLRDFVYAFIFNTLFAGVFTLLNIVFGNDAPMARIFWPCFVFAQCIGYTIWALVIAAGMLLRERRRSTLGRWIMFVVIPLVGAYIGYWIATFLLGWSQARQDLLTWRGAASVLTVSGIITLILLAIFVPRDRANRAEARAARDEARVSAAEREATLARMQLLEAQVEPHFLYNTLAHVVSLVDADPPLAKRMLRRLIELLRATATSAQGWVTLGRELDLVRAYLDLIAMRMGSRLAWSIDVPADLMDAEVPPMLLQPLVENAIKHGLEPKMEGGRVEVRARRDGDTLVMTVTDTGLGVSATRAGDSTGLGLANLRARLAATYDGAASLWLADHPPAGTEATLVLPASRKAEALPTSASATSR